MTVYHGTSDEASTAILHAGFLESVLGDRRGVWLSTWPAAAPGDDSALLAVDLPDDVLDEHEVFEDRSEGEGSRWEPAPRTFFVPAAIVNGYSIRALGEDETADAFARFTWRAGC